MDNLNQLDAEESKETLESKISLNVIYIVLFEMNQILNCGLSKESLVILISMIEKGANPEAVIQLVKDIRNRNFVEIRRNDNSISNITTSNK